MRRAERVNHPMIILLMRNQRADADNRVIDVLWKFIPEFGANFVVGFAFVTIRRSEACEVGYCFNVPYEHVWHVRRLANIAAQEDCYMRLMGLGAT